MYGPESYDFRCDVRRESLWLGLLRGDGFTLLFFEIALNDVLGFGVK